MSSTRQKNWRSLAKVLLENTNGDLKRGLEFEHEEYQEIDRYCREVKIDWFASCWDEASVDLIAQFNVPCFKIASASLTDDNLLRHTRATGKPIILSTGMSTIEEVDHAVEVLGKQDLILLHACSTYPAYYEELNLRVIDLLRERYGVPVGYSGHETGLPSSVAAAVLGACVIERHITLDRSMWGSDHAASLEPNGITRLVRDIRLIEKSMGDGVKRVLEREQPIIKKLRRVGAASAEPCQAKKIKAIAMDVDGVLTDGGVWWGPNGEEWKRFHFADIMGLSLARKSGMVIALFPERTARWSTGWPGSLASPTFTRIAKTRPARCARFSERHGLAPAGDLLYRGRRERSCPRLASSASALVLRTRGLQSERLPSGHQTCRRKRRRAGSHRHVARSLPSMAAKSVRQESMRLADYVMRFVAQQGVKHVFLVTGGGAMHLNDALARCSDLSFVCNHHEQASAIAAENYSKATNNLGVALVTTGPGGTNAITGVAGAWLDSTPILVISGQVKRADRMYRPDGTPLGVRQSGSQEVDIVSLVKPITKYAVTIDDPHSIRYHLEKATHLARTGRPGPVWIDIPIDVQAVPVEPDSHARFDPAESSSAADD